MATGAAPCAGATGATGATGDTWSTRTTGRRQRPCTGDRSAGRTRRPTRPTRSALAALGEVRKSVTPCIAARVARTSRTGRRVRTRGTRAQRSRRQRTGDVEGTGAATVTGRHRSGAAGAGQSCPVRTAGPRTTRRAAHGAAGPRRATGAVRAAGPRSRTTRPRRAARARTGPARANSRTGARCRALRTRTAGQPGPVGAATAGTARGRTGLAWREPVARLLSRSPGGPARGRGVRALGPARTGTRPGLRGGRSRHTSPVGRLAARDGRAHDDRRDGPRSGDVDADPRRQRGLGLGRLRPVTGGTSRVGAVVGHRGGSVRRSPRRVCGSAAPVGPGGRTVSFTTQGRFSRLAPPPVYSTSIRAARRRAPPYWPLVASIFWPSGKPTPDLHLRLVAKWYVTCQVGRQSHPVAALGQGWRTSQRQPFRRAGRGRSPLLRRRGSHLPDGSR